MAQVRDAARRAMVVGRVGVMLNVQRLDDQRLGLYSDIWNWIAHRKETGLQG
jgi:hypothetical protein